jgi:hypothetical protein
MRNSPGMDRVEWFLNVGNEKRQTVYASSEASQRPFTGLGCAESIRNVDSG